MIKVSIIIPVYNTYLYLDDCMISITNQTYKNLEIICVDDHSSDSSIDIIKNYQLKDNRIQLIQLDKNYGPGYARNLGLNTATGDYIIFLDSDDYLSITIIQELVSTITKRGKDLDILIFNGKAFEHKSLKKSSVKYFLLDDSHFQTQNITKENIMNLANCHSACMKLYKFSFLQENNILFPCSIVGEDVEFWMQCLLYLNKIEYLDKIGYYRRYRDGSIMTSNLVNNLYDRINNFDKLLYISMDNILIYSYIVNKYIPYTLYRVKSTQNIKLIKYARHIYSNLIEKYN